MNIHKILWVSSPIKGLFDLYGLLKVAIIQIRCDHNYTYWDTIFKELLEDGSLKDTKFPTVTGSHRLCKSCGKRQRLNMQVNNWHWERVSYEFPKSGPFVAIYNPKGFKSKQEIRDELIQRILS